MPRTLYICYFGLREPLVRTQVIPYLLEIAKGGFEVSLLTFEPDAKSSWTKAQIDAERARLEAAGISWHYLAYHKSPSVPATAFDVLNGARYVRKLLAHEDFDVLHCRVHVAALMGVLARRSSRRKPKIVFDIRGFFPEEYTDAGIWPENGWIYRSVKRVEKWLLTEADAFVVLTEKARQILFPESAGTGLDRHGRGVEVIPCCVDLERFSGHGKEARDEMRSKLGVADRFVIAYVGSFGGWYLSDEMFELFAAAREADPSVFIMILTQRQTETAIENLRAKGFADGDHFVGSVSPAEIPQYLGAADGAVSFIKPCFSKQASSPTKNAEYLASGVPFIANPGIGDVDELIAAEGVGVLTDSFDREAYVAAIDRLKSLGPIAEKCRETARRRFDLAAVGGVRYRRLYERLFSEDSV